MSEIERHDPEVFAAIRGEEQRQYNGLELVPSENYVSRAVREATGSVFTNKYAEGYPGKRYYGGQKFTDQVEQIAIERACKLFGCRYANIQPHSGAPANLAMYSALLEPGDTVLGMELSHGGHLTHGHPVTLPAKIYNFVRYGVKDTTTGEIDYDELRETALREKPKIILAGFSAYTRNLDYKKFVDIAHEVGATTVADISHIAGLVAGKALPNPFDLGFDIITTTTHKTLRGPRGGMILVREDEELSKKINKAVFPGIQGGPHMHHIAAKAVALGEALHPHFHSYGLSILKNAQAMAEVFAAHDVRMMYGGTDNHMILVDAYGSFGITGKQAQEVLEGIGITTNMNSIPDDTRPPTDPSGLRLGTPALTTRGCTTDACRRIAGIIVRALRSYDEKGTLGLLADEVQEIVGAFPLPEKYRG